MAGTEDYRATLQALRLELADLDERREALLAAIAGLEPLVGNEKKPKPGRRPKPEIPSDAFAGLGPTKAYRKLLEIWPGKHSATKIRDAFIQGGMEGEPGKILVAVHSVLSRQRKKS